MGSPIPSRTTQFVALLKTLVFFVLVPGTVAGYFPYRILGSPQIPPLQDFSIYGWAGAGIVVLGTLGLLWCGWNFAVAGLGTPAPFDPPKRLVVRGPYRWVRNPMYVTVATALLGEALFFRSVSLLQYILVFWVIVHLFVFLYEEPTLRLKFGAQYEAYCQQVPRWIPRLPKD